MELISQVMTTEVLMSPKTSSCEADWREEIPWIQKHLDAWNIDYKETPWLPQLCAKVRCDSNAKGVVMYGGCGSGKTLRMRFLSRACVDDTMDNEGITMRTADDICDAFRYCNGDMDYMSEYLNADYRHNWTTFPHRYDLIIDDLGTEAEETNVYGNRCNIMRDCVMPLRYRLGSNGKTYWTTNLTKEQIRKQYGERFFSRMCEMCNWIPLIHADRRLA